MNKSLKKDLDRIKIYLKRYKKYYYLGFICVFIGSLASLIHPMILGYVVDSLREGISWNQIILPGLIIIVVELIGGVFKYFMRQTIIKSSRFIEYDMRNDLFFTLQKQSAKYFQQIKTGDIMSRAVSDIQSVRMMVGPGIMQTSALITRLLFCFSMMSYISMKLTLLTFLPLPFLTILNKTLGGKIHRKFKKVQEQYSSLTADVQENISGIRVVKAYTQEEKEIERFELENRALYDRNMNMFNIIGLFHASFRLFAGLAAAITLWYGGLQVIRNNITLGDFVAFSGYLALLTFPMIALGWVINLFQQGTTSLKRLNFIYDAEPEIVDSEDTRVPESFGGDIDLKNLSFSYDESSGKILNSINLTINGGKSLAIIGHTGSGKTTLVNLLPRIYNPPRGTIFIDGIDILDIPLFELRQNIGFVTQETFLFSETIEENIALNPGNFPKKEIEKISSIVSLDEEIEGFEDSYESTLGERGINLSGGQKQRLAIARALLKKPKILILDDPFSSVDTKTEDKILNNLQNIIKNQTTIIISHRTSTIKDCDMIIVLSEGGIIESGTHDELIKLGGKYFDIYNKQLLQERLDKNNHVEF